MSVVTSLCGRRTIAATTIAVEASVLHHLAEQQKQLAVVDPEAAAIVLSIIDDEQLHHDRSLDRMEMFRRAEGALIGCRQNDWSCDLAGDEAVVADADGPNLEGSAGPE